MMSRLSWWATRPRALWRAWRKLGLSTAVQLAAIRTGSERAATHQLRIPGYPFPITIRGGQSTDAWAVYELLALSEYGLVGDLDSPRFIVDAGANIGIASLYFLHQYPDARIVSVEPHPGNFELLKNNLAPYGKQVTLIQGAVWKRRTRVQLDLGEEEWRTRVRSADGGCGGVEAFPLAEIIARGGGGPVDLLKMDIEGSEIEVFGPEAQEWLPGVRNLVIELHSKACVDRFFQALSGYRFDQPKHHKDNVAVCRNLRAPSVDRLDAPVSG